MIDVNQLAQAIRLIALDVDGVMSDGRVIYGNTGEETKAFNIKDGLGIKLAQSMGIEVAIITGRTALLLDRRAKELGINAVIQGREDKRAALQELADSRDINLMQCAYMGDDLPDLGAILAAGLGTCPADAVAEVKSHADWVSAANGGRGAVRDLCEVILKAQGHWPRILATYAS